MPDASRTVLTYRYERWRALSAGILETAGGTFLLLIAVRWYHAGSLAKALVDRAPDAIHVIANPVALAVFAQTFLGVGIADHHVERMLRLDEFDQPAALPLDRGLLELPEGGRIDAVFFCPHAQDAGCACRKPKPGMLLEIAARFNVALAGVPAIGDGLRDL